MECKKCGANNPDEAVFCAKCGARLDGKTACPSCGRLNDEENNFCGFCGARLDGKTVCKTCGAVFEGAFCPKCGAGKNAAFRVPQTGRAEGQLLSSKKYLRIVQISLMYAAIALLFVFCFFTGFSQSYNEFSENFTSFKYFLFDVWKILSSRYDDAFIDVPSAASYFNAIFSAAATAFNLAVCTVFFILATISFAKNIGRREVAFSKYFIPPAVSSFATLAFLSSHYCVYSARKDSFFGPAVSVNGATIAEIVLVSCLAAAVIVLSFFLEKNLPRRLWKIIPCGIAAVLSVAAIGSLVSPFFTHTVSPLIDYYSAGTYLVRQLMSLTDFAPFTEFSPLAYLAWLFLILFAVFASLFLLYLLKKIFSEKKRRSGIALGALSLAMAVGYLVFCSLYTEKVMYGIPYGLGAVTTVVLIALAFAAAIVGAVLGKKADAPVENETKAEV